MPTIEIVSFERQTPLRIKRSKYNFVIRQNSKLISHRGLFQNFLNENHGVILHLGDLELAREPFFFAGDLIDWDFEGGVDVTLPVIDFTKPYEEQWNGCGQMERFKFHQCFLNGVDDLLKKALNFSPIKKCCFLTDIQLGPEFSAFFHLDTIEEFWRIHNSVGLVWNTMYIIGSP